MSRAVLYLSMSLDGYIAGPNDEPDNPGGDDFMRLHEWYGFASDPEPTGELLDPSGMGKHFLDEVRSTGAVLSGRNTVEQADYWGGDRVATTASQSSCPLTGRRVRRSRSTHWSRM